MSRFFEEPATFSRHKAWLVSKAEWVASRAINMTDAKGRRVGEAVAQKPNVFGEVKIVHKDASGKTTGQAVTTKSNVFGEVKTKFRARSLPRSWSNKPAVARFPWS